MLTLVASMQVGAEALDTLRDKDALLSQIQELESEAARTSALAGMLAYADVC